MAKNRDTFSVEDLQIGLINIETRLGGFDQRISRLGGIVEDIRDRVDEMNRRMSNVERLQRRALRIVISAWLTLMLSSLGLYFKW
jgi:hypothetical protein